jgi:hypothetical protein
MNAPAPQLDESERPHADSPRADLPRAATIKFTYPSGSRPLEGYTIKRGVGRGGFGEVYFATSDAGKEVALKLIRRNLDVELRGVSQCLNLKHPNLIALYDIRTDEMGDQWVVMEYVSGESLEDVIEHNPNGLPIEQALYWMRGLCAGVAYLHDHGIVHRDLKPGNIFSDEGTVKIGDYGLAKFISCSRRSGQTESVGTVHYMAPEIANGRYGREIDTYALGIILFEMLTGHVPFEGESVGEVLMKHLTAEPDLSVLQEPYRDIVKRALAKDPNVRIKSVSELVALLPGGGEPMTHFANLDARPEATAKPAASSVIPPMPPMPKVPPYAAEFGRKVREEFAKTGQHVADHFAVEEPIAKALRTAWASIRGRWHGEGKQPFSLMQKALIVIAVIVLCRWFVEVGAIKVLVQCAIIYAIYYMFWLAIIRPNIRTHLRDTNRSQSPGEPAAATGSASQKQPTQHDPNLTAEYTANLDAEPSISRYEEAKRRRRSRANWRDRVHQELAARPLRDKLTELFGSMLLAAVFSAIAALAVPFLFNNPGSSEAGALYFWLAIVGTLGSWAVLIPSKFVEGKLEDQVPMRITLMLLGALLGVVAWFVADSLLLSMPSWREPVNVNEGLISHEILRWPKTSEGINPNAAVYISYFAFLFLLPRWWRQTEYTRRIRMSLWGVVTCVFTAWLLHIFWWFPQPAGMLAAATIALSTQLASPWMPPSKRRTISESADQSAV